VRVSDGVSDGVSDSERMRERERGLNFNEKNPISTTQGMPSPGGDRLAVAAQEAGRFFSGSIYAAVRQLDRTTRVVERQHNELRELYYVVDSR
jgi:hypothetical protein